MQKQTFLDYISAYNSDKTQLGRFYSPDLIFENFTLTLSGAELGAFFQSLHGVLEDRIDPVTLVVDEGGAALFGRHTFTALKDASLPIGDMKAGEKKGDVPSAVEKRSGGVAL